MSMRILAIETSCDETGVAIVEGEKTPSGFTFKTLGSALLSQAMLHSPYGGVYPNLAKREHIKNLPTILDQALTNAGLIRTNERMIDGVDAIAVTHGPGLEPALWTGIEFAKKLAAETNLPLLPTNHMEGHLISSLVQDGKLEDTKLPVLALLISGGHTEFVLMKNWFEYQIVGETLDDAVGEAFDKVARMLGLAYPGGPEISKLAARARAEQKPADVNAASGQGEREQVFVKLPRPMLQTKNCDMSFSGLKTAALYALRGKELGENEKAAFAREFEDSVADILVSKSRRALEETEAKTFVIGGGVAANSFLRSTLQKLVADEFPDVVFRLPELAITGDNAIMIAQAALVRSLSGVAEHGSDETRAIGNLSLAKN